MQRILAGFLFCSATAAMASTVAIVDSGTWTQHDWIANQTWQNTAEIAGNMVDDDRNGKVDDILGWNFAENGPTVFFPDHIASATERTYKVFDLLGKTARGTITAEEKQWWADNVTSLDAAGREKLSAELNWYGGYAHGTHTAGIVAHGNPAARIMVARMFPDSLPPEVENMLNGIVKSGVKGIAHELLAQQSNAVFAQVATYLNEKSAVAANYSLGIPLENVAKQYLALIGQKDPTAERVAQESWKFYDAFAKQGKKWMASSPNTLFVIAAGNDGKNIEEVPFFPANLQEANSITVAATLDFSSLASFSNYGPNLVHVAAPGVAIQSSVPGPSTQFTLPLSGTSMAAPYVTMVASRIVDANVALKAADVRRILIETVDKKDWLVGKVSSAGVVNVDRAVAAAQFARSESLGVAISHANSAIVAQPESVNDFSLSASRDMVEWSNKIAF